MTRQITILCNFYLTFLLLLISCMNKKGDFLAPLDSTVLAITPTPTTEYSLSVASGGKHTCATLSSGESKCWGSHEGGRIGDGTVCLLLVKGG